jgi:hypothetical protein
VAGVYSASTVGGLEKLSKSVDACDWTLVELVASRSTKHKK